MRRINRIVAWVALVALAWPSLGALPWLAEPTQVHAVVHVHAQGSQLHQDGDSSTIPGSPTHPVDHNCFECQVLQHLARCIFVSPTTGIVPPTVVCDAAPRVAVALLRTQVAMVLPPARAPPSSFV